MKFGIQTGPQQVTWEEVRTAWQIADGAGLDSAWVYLWNIDSSRSGLIPIPVSATAMIN